MDYLYDVPAISHHFLPQMYLRRFTHRQSKDVLWEYDKTTGLARPSSPKRSGCEDHYHTVKMPDGTIDTDSIEAALARIENDMALVYESLRNHRPLTETEWKAFYVFAGLMLVRVPRFVSTVDDVISNVVGAGFEMLQQSPQFVKACKEQGVPAEILPYFKAQANRDYSLSLCLDSMDLPVELFSQMGWAFLKAPANETFLTGDNPVTYRIPGRAKSFYGVGLGDQDVEVTFPLSRNLCAVGAWKEPAKAYVEVTAKEVRIANACTARAAKRYLYCARNDPRFFVPKPVVPAEHSSTKASPDSSLGSL